MGNLKIAFFETKPWEEEYLKSRLDDFDTMFFEEKLNEIEIEKISDVDVISPFIYSEIDEDTICSLSNLKYITTRSTGFDHVNLNTCRDKGVLISNVPVYGENTVAEHTFALILALSRKLYPSIERTKKGNFSIEGLRGFDLKGKTLGVVGTGSIGAHVIRIARGFDMKVLGYDVNENEELAREFGFEYVSLEDLFENSDITTLHVPYNEATHHLVNMENLKMFKKGSFLINTSRGSVCDTTALLHGLKDGVFAGLGLDVLEEEHAIKEEAELLAPEFENNHDLRSILENHMLIHKENVIITPHSAFNSKEAIERILDTTIKNIKSFSKKEPVNLVE